MRTALRPQRFALLRRQYDQWMTGPLRGVVEKRVRPGLATQLPAKHQPQHVCEHYQVLVLARTPRNPSDSVLAEYGPTRTAEELIALASVGCASENLQSHPDKGQRWRQRIAQGRLATACIPAMQSLRCEAKPYDTLCPPVERNSAWRHLDDICPALGVEQIGAFEMMQERLAVVTVTDGAIDRTW